MFHDILPSSTSEGSVVINRKRLEDRTFQIINVPELVTTWFQNDNIPTYQEGVRIGQLAITPSAPDKILKITASYYLGRTPSTPNNRVWGYLALFVAGLIPALSAEAHMYILNDAGDTPVARLVCTAFFTPGVATLHTFQARIGHNGNGGNDNITLNGNDVLGGGSRVGGGSLLSYMEIEEVN